MGSKLPYGNRKQQVSVWTVADSNAQNPVVFHYITCKKLLPEFKGEMKSCTMYFA